MHWLRIIGVFLIVALFQVTIVPALEVRAARPDLLLLVAFYVVVREPLEKRWRWNAFWVGWVAGLLEDVYSAGSHLPVGSAALVFGLAAMAMSRLGEQLFLESALAQAVVLAPACLAVRGALALALAAKSGGAAGPMLGDAFWCAVYSGLAAPLVFAAMRPLERFLGLRSRRSFGRV